jgi:pyruvate/2-oxoglutarate dehydrogenase complex dihydrolipoamide acyltransferase (E2) component
VRQSTIAPAEIVPAEPAPIRAPVEGVIDAVLVAPNEVVRTGQPLVRLDRIALVTRAEVAEKSLEMARAEYQVASQQALNDQRAKARMPLLSAKIDQQTAELALARDTLARAIMTAPRDGIAVFDGAVDWIGKPVALGERIMLIAAAADSLLEIQVPAGDVVGFAEGSDIRFFSNLAPDTPVAGTITFASYATTLTQDGIAAYTYRARLERSDRLGLKGSAKLYGPEKPLALWLLRKPIAAVRQWLAL